MHNNGKDDYPITWKEIIALIIIIICIALAGRIDTEFLAAGLIY